MNTATHKGEKSQPEAQKQVRDTAAKILTVMDAGLG
jgi:hypothetical protein